MVSAGPAATVIVPLLAQQRDYLKECLASLSAQTTPCKILVVVSPDTPAKNRIDLEAFQARHAETTVLMQKRPSFAAALNTGIDAADTDRVCLVLSDDWLRPQAVEICMQEEADIVSASMSIYDAPGTRRLPFTRPRTCERYAALDSLHDRANFLGHMLLFRRDALNAVGGVDETIGNVGPDDFDLIWTLLEMDASVAVVEDELYCYRDHGGPRLTLRDRNAQIADLHRIFDKHRVFGEERDRLLKRHVDWFGKTLQQVVAEREVGDHLPQDTSA